VVRAERSDTSRQLRVQPAHTPRVEDGVARREGIAANEVEHGSVDFRSMRLHEVIDRWTYPHGYGDATSLPHYAEAIAAAGYSSGVSAGALFALADTYLSQSS
jgi:hypothetical protein